MKLSCRIACYLFAFFVSATALAQGTSPAVTVLPIDTIVVARGGNAPLNIELKVNKGFHVNSNKPVGEQLALPFMGNDKLSVYSGNFAVTAEVRVPKSAALGTLRVHGEVKYQACDNRQCFPPKTAPLEFDVKVVKPKAVKKSTYTAASPHIR
jgi:hypothetical protein